MTERPPDLPPGAQAAGRAAWLLAALLALTAACGGKGDAPAEHRPPSAGRPGPSAERPAPDAPSDCPPDGRWHACSVVKRLEMAGYVPVVEDSAATQEPLSAKGTTYRLGRGTLTVFLYPDEGARAADAARLDTTRFIGPYQPVTMLNEPARIASVNLLAILRTRSDQQRERVADVLTAGPPQRQP